MTYQVIVRPLAERDLLDAKTWYDLRRPGLGREFLDTFEEVRDRLAHTPLIYPVVHRGIRRAVLRRFPYLVYFAILGNTVSVIACLHAARDPQVIRSRS